MRRNFLIILLMFQIWTVGSLVEGSEANVFDVAKVQKQLIKLGCPLKSADGVWNKDTEQALNNLFPLGILDSKFNNWNEIRKQNSEFGPSYFLSEYIEARNRTRLLVHRSSSRPVSASAEIRPQIGHASSINEIRVAPDSQLVASLDGDGQIKLWDVASVSLLGNISTSHREFRSSMRFAKGREQLVVGSREQNAITLWDIKAGHLLRIFEVPCGVVNEVAVSPDGKRLASANTNATVTIWNIASGQSIRTLRGHQGEVSTVSFSPDGRHIVTGGSDRTVKIWDTATGRTIKTQEVHDHPIRSVTFSPDGTLVASSSWDKLTVWQSDSGMLLLDMGTPFDDIRMPEIGFGELKFLGDGRSLAAQWGESIILYDIHRGKIIRNDRGIGVLGSDFDIIQETGEIISSYHDLEELEKHSRTRGASHKLYVWSTKTGLRKNTFQNYSDEPAAYIKTSLNSSMIISGGISGGLAKVWDLSTGELISRPSAYITYSNVTPDGSGIVFYRDGHIRKTDVATGVELQKSKRKFEDVRAVFISRDTKKALLAQKSPKESRYQKLTFWDIESDKAIASLENAVERRGWRRLSLSQDASRIAMVGSADTIDIWQAKPTLKLLSLSQRKTWGTSFALSGNGAKIASIGTNGVVEIRVVDTRQILARIAPKDLTPEHVVFSPDGSQFAIADKKYKNVQIRNVSSGEMRSRLHSSLGNYSMTFSFDGSNLLLASADSSIDVWNIRKSKFAAKLVGQDSRDWLAFLPEGFFATSNLKTPRLRVVRDFKSFSMKQFYQSLSRPDLVREALAGDPRGAVAEAAKRINLDAIIDTGDAPKIEIVYPVKTKKAQSETVDVRTRLTESGGGIGRVEWRVNGITVGLEQTDLKRLESGKPLQARTVELNKSLTLAPGENTIEIAAYNAANLIASEPAKVAVYWEGPANPQTSTLHVLAVGVNEYWDSRLRLRYAVKDARAVAETLKTAGPQYRGVKVHMLVDDAVTRAGLDDAFTKIARDVRPNDVFVFFLAGHGKTIDGRYYFLPQDFRYRSEKSIITDGIGQDTWQAWLARLQVRKSLLLYDTCESGSLTGERVSQRGLERVTAFDKFTSATGRTILSASTDDAPALEGYKGHGVFTFAVLDALRNADTNKNDLIEVTELAAYVDRRVPEISYKSFGFRQIPQFDMVGSNFPIGSRVASVAIDNEPLLTIPTEPTHILASATTVYREADSSSPEQGPVAAWTVVRVIEETGDWSLIARDGSRLGFVPSSMLKRIQ